MQGIPLSSVGDLSMKNTKHLSNTLTSSRGNKIYH